MKYTDLTKTEWNQSQYNHKMTELENFLVRMIVKFYDTDPSNAEDAFNGLYNRVDWIALPVASEAGVDVDYEEMQELDPRDYERLDDYGDPTT